MSPLNITHPWMVYGLLDGYYKVFQVMSNIPKMGQLPTPDSYWTYSISSWLTYSKWTIFYSYVSLPEGNVGKNYAINHPWLGMVNIPPIFLADLGDGLWHCFTHIMINMEIS